MQHILLLLAIFITGVKSSGYYFVTAPNVIRFEHNETVVVSVFELTNASVSVWLQYKKDVFSLKNVTVPNEINPINTTLRVSENDLFHPDFETDKPRRIDICSKWNDITQCREVVLSYRTGYLIVQTDKPIYSPLQKVNVRTLALDESLKGVTKWQVGMDIVSPSNITLARKTVTESNSGFYSNQFTLPDYPELGIWTARAFYRGQFETESRSLFEVKEYVLPTFGVTIDIDVPYILNDTKHILVTVKASYVYGKPVRGNARLALYLKEQNGSKEYILDIKKKPLEHNVHEKVGVTEFKIGVDDIRNSSKLKEQGFPYYDGKRLEVNAFVYESATGKEEGISNENTFFTLKPYIFKFTRSKVNFRPGMEYYLKIDMLFANGQPATEKALKVHMYKNGVPEKSDEQKTDTRGQAVLSFSTITNTTAINFTAETSDGQYKSEHFLVNAYSGKNQIQVENIIKDNVMYLRAFTNIQGSEYTGMMFMVVSRGKIVYKKFKQSTNKVSEAFVKQLQEKVSPSARLVVFYVDKENNETVADSVKFDVDKKCRGDGLKIHTSSKVTPGSKDQLIKVTGSPYMWVGFNVMDKALFVLNDKNVLRKGKMFEVLESHDLGCGEGSGKSSADVFKNSGLTVLTNAKVEANDLVRNLDDCNVKKRKRRDDENCYYGANNECCHLGKMYANESYHQNDKEERMDAYTVCYAKARQLAIDKTFHAKCILAYFVTCRQSLEDLLSERGDIMSKSLGDETEYKLDLERLSSIDVEPTPRTDFRESWLFDIDQLNSKGDLIKFVTFPQSVTEWMIQAVGITPDKGMCIADGISVNAFRDFFIQLDLPYKTVRLETFDVKATIFNYRKGDLKVNVYLHGVENLCSNIKPGKVSPRVQIKMSPNSAQTVNFPVIPLKQGIYKIRVSAFTWEDGLPVVDVVEKELLVENEGIQEQMTINVCLHQGSQNDYCANHNRVINEVQVDNERKFEVDLTLPKGSIPQTGVATAYLQSNIMETVVQAMVEGVESLFKDTAGCCEQKLVKLAPTVYAMNYLKQTNQMTVDLERKGSDLIRNGVSIEISSHRHSKNGYYYCYDRNSPGTWLTAFVTKMFCQAKKIVSDAVNENGDIVPSILWLTKNIKNNGSFLDDHPVMASKMGQTKKDQPSLTAFVLITLLECDVRPNKIRRTVQQATNRLERLSEEVLKADPFLLAISTYALALANSPSKFTLKKYLHDIQRNNNEGFYWGLNDHSTADAFTVETTAYALLAMQTFNDLKTSKYIARWLVSQRKSHGSFKTTQDTVVALQALSKYTILTFSPDVDIKVNLSANQWDGGANLTLTRESSSVQKIVRKLPVERGDNKLIIKVSGTGTGIMAIDLRYNRPATEEESCPFEISDIEVDERDDFSIDQNLAKDLNCDVCGCPTDGEQSDDNVEFNKSTIVSSSNHELERRRRETDSNEVSRKTCVRFSVSSKNEIKKYGMSIVKFGLQTGVDVVKEDIKKLFESEANIERYEMPFHGKGFIVFYLHEITSNKTNFIFRLEDNLTSGKFTRQSSRVYVYDYYNPEQSCSRFYDIVPKRGDRKRYWCNPNQRECQCIQSECVEPVEEKLIGLARKREWPAPWLMNYTCDPEKANYAVLVKIESIKHEPENRMKVARGTVLKVINHGHTDQSAGDEMTFFWDEFCENPSFELETNYYIIGKNGFSTSIEQELGYRYPLKESALVIRDATVGLLHEILNKYKEKMEKGCEG